MTFDNQAEIIGTRDSMMIISFFINIIVFVTQFISSAPKHVQPTDKQTIQTVHYTFIKALYSTLYQFDIFIVCHKIYHILSNYLNMI